MATPSNLLQYISSLKEEELSNISFLENMIIYEIGIRIGIRFRTKFNIEAEYCRKNLCCKQYPNELAKFLLFIYQHRNHINNYLEIGIERAGTFILVDSYLQAINPNYTGSVGVDINPKIKHLGPYLEQSKNCKIQRMYAHQYESDIKFDLCFIDADHNYKAVKADFDRMRAMSKIIALHDVFLEPGVKHLWKEIKAENDPKDYTEITNDSQDNFAESLGIGILHHGLH